MRILFIIIPVCVGLLGFAVWALFWAVDSGQFENLDEIGRRLPDDDAEPGP